MNKLDVFAAIIAVFAVVDCVYSIYDPRAYPDERNYNHGNNFIEDDSPKTECPAEFTGLVPYAIDCRQFLNCWRGRGSIQSCPPGTMFNPRNLECDHPSKVKCRQFEGFSRQSRNEPYRSQQQQQQQPIQCEAGVSGLYAHPHDCTKFLNCDHGRTFIQDCGPGTMFNDIFKVCDWPHKVDCGTRSSSGDQTFAENRRHDTYYGEGQMDVRSDFATERVQPTHGHGFPAHDIRNQRRYPDHAHHPQQTFPSSPSSFNSQNPNVFVSTIEIPERTQVYGSTVGVENVFSPADSNKLESGGKIDSLAHTKASNDRTGRLDDSLVGSETRNFESTIDSNILDPKPTKPWNNEDVQQSSKSIPELNYMSPRVADDFRKYSSDPSTTTKTITTPRPSQNDGKVVMLDGEPVTQKVKSVYPSGFEELGSQCDETGTGLDEHPYDCTKFVTCENGRMRVQSCGMGFMFNPMLKICDFARNVPSCRLGNTETVDQTTEQDALNEIHDDDQIKKTTPSPQLNSYPGTYYIPDMSVIPLATATYPSYPEVTTERQARNYPVYSGYGKPSQGADIQPEQIDDHFRRINSDRFEPTTLRGHFEETTTEKEHQNVMKIPSGKEHVMPIYNRPTRPTSKIPSSTRTVATTTTTQKPYSPLQNYNQIYYQPFAQPPNDTEPETDYIPISEALKLLLRPYIVRNDTKTLNGTDKHMGKIENKILDIADGVNNVKTPHNKSLEQDDLAAAHFNENVAVKSLPEPIPTTAKPKTENRLGVEQIPLDHVGNNLIEDSGKHDEPVTHHQHHNYHSPTSFHGSSPPFSPNFKHSPEFHKKHPHLNSNNYNPNQIVFPGPSNSYNYHQMHANQPGGNHPSNLNHNNAPPPTMHSSHYHHGHHPHQNPNRYDTEATIPTTASAPSPWQPRAPSTASRFGRVDSDSVPICDGQFSCGNGKCIPLSQLCDGRNDCGNRYDELNCPRVNYQVRLSNEKGHKHMGRVEVRAYGKWGYVCDDKFTITNANVVCRELGFNMGAAEVKPNSFYPPNQNVPANDNMFTMDEVSCTGNETSLKECDFDGWGVSDCNAEEVVGVVCKVTVMQCPPNHWLCQTSEECVPMSFMCDGLKDCTDGTDESEMHCKAKIEYRLMDGNNELEGRVEVKYRGVWGTVCDDDFGANEANVFCKSLGFDGPAEIVNKRFGMSTGPIWLDQVNCLGNETGLDRCMHFEWSESNCNHTEDVSVRCSYGSDAKSSRYISADENRLQRLTNDEQGDYLRHIQRSSKSIPIPDYSNQCGRIKVTEADDSAESIGQFRVISGSRTKRGHHPWQATIRARGRNGRSSHWCGAVVISKNHILTAAHCLIGFPKGAYFVRLGDHHSEVYENSEMEIYIENWFIHEDFRKDQLMNNDIAVILLKSPIQFTNFIQPICLPTPESKYEPGKNCTISGWGSIQYGKSTPSLDLKAAHVPLISQEVCRRKEIYGEDIMDTMFCAGNYPQGGQDACDGDSGGPLVCPNEDGVNELFGIISWGQRCGDSTKPGVYVKVAQYLEWIKEKMNLLI